VNCEEEWGFGLWGSTSSEGMGICRFGGLPDSAVCSLPSTGLCPGTYDAKRRSGELEYGDSRRLKGISQ
jgi:hypothetical protein